MRGLKYVSEYSDIKGGQYKVEVWVEGYSSTPIPVTMGGDPVVITRNKSVPEIYLGGIVPTFYSFQFLTAPGFNSSSFLSENYGDVIIKHFTGAATTPDFEAIVSPFVTEEADLSTGMSVFTLQGECGLEYLRNKKIPVTLTEARLIDIVREGIDLIPGETDFPYKVIDNTRVYTSAGLVNDGAYFIERLINKQTFKDLTYYEVFEQLFAARVEIVFDSGAWHIRNLSELSQVFSLAGRSATLVNYSAGGVRGSTQVINSGTTKVRKAGGVFGRLFSQKNIVIERGEVEKINFITNGSFDQSPLVGGYPPGWTANGSFSSATDTANGWFQMGESIHTPSFVGVDNAYLQSSSVSWRPYFSLSGQWEGAEKMFFVVDQVAGNNIRTGRYQVIATSDTGRVLYLNADGSWVTNATFFEKSGNFEYELPIPPNLDPVTVANFDQSVSFTVLVRIFRPARNTSNPSVGGGEDFQRWFDVKLNKDSAIDFEKIDSGERVDYRANEDADRENKLQIKSLIALKNAFPYRHGSLLVSTANEITGFESPFGFGLGGFPYELYLSNSYLGVTSNRLRTYRGNLYDSVGYVDIIQIDSTRYRIQDFTYSIKFQDAGVYLIELLYTSPSEILTREINDRADEAVRKVIEQINQSNIIPQDFNFQSQGQFGGRTTFGIRPDTRFQSTNIQQLFLRVDDSDPDVSITPAGGEINLLTPAKVGAGLDEIIATREWANLQFQPVDADLTALAGLSGVGVVRRTGAGAFATMAGTSDRLVKWGANGVLQDTIIRENSSQVIIGADTALSTFSVVGTAAELGLFRNTAPGAVTRIRVRNDQDTGVLIGVNGSAVVGGTVFSTGANGSYIASGGSGPFAIGSNVEQPLIFGTFGVERARLTPLGFFLLNTTSNPNNARMRVDGVVELITSLTTPIIGNPAGVTANNTWTFTSNINVPLLPTASAHATSKQYVDNLVATGIKEGIPVRTIALTNITLSGTQTISDVAVIAGDRVLVAGQSTQSQNGVYIAASGTWSRATDSDTDLELRGFQYLILEGDFRNAKYRNTNESAIVVGTTAITYVISQGAELDPIFTESPAFIITNQNITDWNSVFSAWGGLVPNDWFNARFDTKTTTDLDEGTNLYFTSARALSAVQSALDAKQNLNSILTALTGISGNGVVRWNGTAFSASAIAIGDVTNLSTTLAALDILKDGTVLFPLNGVREIRSIDYHQARMDFGFDKTLDIPYLFYDTGSKILVNYMNDNGVWVHVDQNGEEKRYLREGDVATIGTPNLQQVSQAGRNSTLRLQFNGINYALEGPAPNLNSVLASGANSSIRAQLNGVGYATLAEVGGGGGTVGSLAAVLAVGNNTNGIDINLNGFGVIRTGDVSGVPTVTIGNNANVDINSFNTIRIQSTNIRLNSGNLFGVNDFVDIGVTLDSTRFSKLLMGTIDGQDGKYITLRGNFIGIRGVEATGSPSAMFLDAKQIVIGSQTPGGVDVFRVAPNVITIGDVVGGPVLQPKFNFRPAAFTNGQKYVFEYNSATNTFNLVNA